jgi:hypothetical protein
MNVLDHHSKVINSLVAQNEQLLNCMTIMSGMVEDLQARVDALEMSD